MTEKRQGPTPGVLPRELNVRFIEVSVKRELRRDFLNSPALDCAILIHYLIQNKVVIASLKHCFEVS